jgi:hypothetical protein
VIAALLSKLEVLGRPETAAYASFVRAVTWQECLAWVLSNCCSEAKTCFALDHWIGPLSRCGIGDEEARNLMRGVTD